MRATFLWMGLGAGAAFGYMGGWSVTLRIGALLGPALWGLCAAATALAVVDGIRRTGRPAVRFGGFLTFGLIGLAVLRGFEVGVADRIVAWPAAARGPASGLRELEVVRASSTGRWCEVRVREPGTRIEAWLSAPRSACPLAAGERIAVSASRLGFMSGPPFPGSPDPRRTAIARGARLRAHADAVWSVDTPGFGYWAWVARARHRAWQWTRGDDPAAFVAASALGVRAALSPERRAELRAAGLGHLIAVSGLHVALAAWMVHALLVRAAALVGRSPAWGVAASWIPLVGYVGLTGASAPAVRAAAMLSLVGLGVVVGRPGHGMHLLMVAAATMLLIRPAWAMDPGFQLSLTAMIALVRAPAGTGIVGHSWRIAWAILPVSAIHFGQTGAYAVLANLVAIPVFTVWILPTALVGWGLGTWLGPSGLRLAAAGAEIVLDVSAVLAALPPVPLGALVVVAAIGCVLRACSRRWGRRTWVHRVAPSVVASLATFGAWMWIGSRPTADPGAWMVVGSRRAHAVAAVVEDDTGTRFACLHGSGLGPSGWIALLPRLGISRVAAVEPISRGRGGAPHLMAIRRALEQAGRWGGDPAQCELPDADVTRAAIAACVRRAGRGRALVLGPSASEPARCFVSGRFEPLATMLAEQDHGQ